MRRNGSRFFQVRLILAGLLLLITAPAMLAQGGSQEIKQTYSHIYRNAKLESNFSKMASKSSQNAGVKQLAKQVISENNSIQSLMFTYAVRDGYQLIGEAPAEAVAAQKKMKSLTGTDFDKVYLTQMASIIKDDLQAVQEAGNPPAGSELAGICAKVQSQSADRMKQITQLASGENFIIQ